MDVTLFWANQAQPRLADYTVTEAGFVQTLALRNSSDIKTPNLPTSPDAVVVIVATLRAALHKMNGGGHDALQKKNVEAVRAAVLPTWNVTLRIIRKFGIPAVVEDNEFVTADSCYKAAVEIVVWRNFVPQSMWPVELASVWADDRKVE